MKDEMSGTQSTTKE